MQAASLAEALAWLEQSGLDRDKAMDILKKGAPGSPLLAGLSARMISRDYTVNFLLNLMSKDLQYAHDAAAQCEVDLTTAESAHSLFETAASRGYGRDDMASVIEPLRTKAQR